MLGDSGLPFLPDNTQKTSMKPDPNGVRVRCRTISYKQSTGETLGSDPRIGDRNRRLGLISGSSFRDLWFVLSVGKGSLFQEGNL